MAVTVTRIDDAIDEPLFARKVTHDSSARTYADWRVTADQYSDGTNFDTYPFAGFIGQMEAETQLTLTAVNNAVKSNGSAQIHSASNNVGLLCQTMGAGASLTATYSGTNTSFAISTASGNAGGLVGQMAAGSHLTVTMSGNPQSAGDAISTASGYAGGIVGYNDGGTITLNIPSPATININQTISGTTAAGAIYGYFRPVFTSNAAEFDINGYNLSGAVLEATGSVGGLFGVLENAAVNSTEDTITIKTTGATDTVSPTNGTAGHTNYGGLIGKYTANETNDTLIITDLKANITNNVSVNAIVTNYGGAIGCVDSDSYVSINNFELSGATNIAAANATNFGGLVANAEGAYIYVNGATIGTSELTGFDGGGLVGSLGDGVLGMTGTINLSNAKPTAAATNGQIVGSRDNALVYSENIAASGSNPASTWTYTPSSIEVDNIGSWGDVVFFDGTTLAKGDVIASETNHVITFNTANPSDIDSVADYAIVSLLFQIDPSKNSFLNGTQLAENVALTFSGDITLTGTGLRGITRDNGSGITYSGTIIGGSKTVTLDIKNIGGTDRPVYYHTYNGLIGKASNVTVNNLYLGGNIIVNPRAKDKYIGAFAAVSQGALTASGCKTLSTLDIGVTNSGENTYIAGRFVGSASGMNTISFSKIKLDARKTASTPALTSHGYNTTKSIFTRATLLESMVNESGDYTYTYADDWTDGHKVTYGEEVGYTTSSKPTSQYPDQEQWYYRTSTSETKLATQYSSAPTGDSTSDSFGGFLPYVKTVSTAAEISAGTGTYYQLKVNHQPSEVIQGCGTYNDPYIIKTEEDFVKISRWIGGNDLGNATINYLLNDTWCDGKTEHATQTGFSISTSASPTIRNTSDAKKWVFMYPKSTFAIESQTYQIPISYSVYTGNTPAFEQSSRKYSNYEVKITASMWRDGGEGEETYVYVPNSENSDYIKYTNARIYIERVNPNKAEPQP